MIIPYMSPKIFAFLAVLPKLAWVTDSGGILEEALAS